MARENIGEDTIDEIPITHSERVAIETAARLANEDVDKFVLVAVLERVNAFMQRRELA